MKPVIIRLSLILISVLLVQCEKELDPSITLKEIKEITPHSIIVNFEVNGDVGSIIQAGFICNLADNPSIRIARFYAITFRDITFNIHGLSPGSLYRLTAYVSTSKGNFWSDEELFITLESRSGTFTDSRDGNSYNWVEIGNQIWMAENLAYLPTVNPATSSSGAEPKYYVFGYSGSIVSEAKATDNYNTYGVLYNWVAAMDVCPDGWHLPDDNEWKELEVYLGMRPGAANARGLRGDGEGDYLKETGSAHWRNNENATNGSGFTALPGGYFNPYGSFSDMNYSTKYWSATEREDRPWFVWDRELFCWHEDIGRDYSEKLYGFCVRCVKDTTTYFKK
jgi:uncharacterized protein (TIGR02145 family)